MKKVLIAVVLVAFTIVSSVLVFEAGLGGLAMLRTGWSLQVSLDLAIAMFFVGSWIQHDAKKHGINPLPFLIALPFLGSIGGLLYVCRRNFLPLPSARPLGRPVTA